jgi:hypothetical protein
MVLPAAPLDSFQEQKPARIAAGRVVDKTERGVHGEAALSIMADKKLQVMKHEGFPAATDRMTPLKSRNGIKVGSHRQLTCPVWQVSFIFDGENRDYEVLPYARARGRGE